jgi:formylglycine-generating enzyme required for sulfatase activity
MVYVPAGEFEMGSDDGNSDEKPVHAVALDGFWIDLKKVANTQYRWCVESGECSAPVTCDWGTS